MKASKNTRAQKMKTQNSNHLSYLLRIWNDNDGGEWHATVQDVISGECFHYATLYELYVNLKEFTREDGHIRQQILLKTADSMYVNTGK
jgi:hypothetical protein